MTNPIDDVILENAGADAPLFRVVSKETGETVATGQTAEEFMALIKESSIDPSVIRRLLEGAINDEEE